MVPETPTNNVTCNVSIRTWYMTVTLLALITSIVYTPRRAAQEESKCGNTSTGIRQKLGNRISVSGTKPKGTKYDEETPVALPRTGARIWRIRMMAGK